MAGAAGAAGLRVPPARAERPTLAELIRAHTGGAELRAGRVRLDIAPLVENGNAVPVTITVDTPGAGPGQVQAIALFNERNPHGDVFAARLSPHLARAQVATRIRLATSQRLVALAQFADGSWWSDEAMVVVTLAACVEG